jgi:benzoyl-CoA reductase/2-hydroxyglutaryl-CoA dehydratase subunit BcrC/BadD/HgdB
MKTIIYTCAYVPGEWIAAHGLSPSRLLLNHVDSASMFIRTEGACPFVRSFISEVVKNKDAAGVITTTVCDQMRRAFDIIVRKCELPAFLMNVPNTWQNPESQKLYVDELKRLSRFMVRLGGTSASNEVLAKIMLEYESTRKSIRGMKEYLSSRQYAEAIASFGRDGADKTPYYTTKIKPQTNVVPLAMIGGPLMRQDFALFDVIEQSGGRIVLDATETGERGMCTGFDHLRTHEEPLMELANAYFGGIQDASRRPNNELYKWLQQELAARQVRGIIFHRYLWCDMWHTELRRLKDWTELPVLDIDMTGDTETDEHRTENRIRAFLEMLQ